MYYQQALPNVPRKYRLPTGFMKQKVVSPVAQDSLGQNRLMGMLCEKRMVNTDNF